MAVRTGSDSSNSGSSRRSAVGSITVTVTVTGHRAGYTDVARTSTATTTVVSGNLTAPAPTITGTAAVGRTLSANPGTWAPATTQLAYQWKAGGTAIPDATAATLQIPASALGQAITVSVTGTAAGYTTTTTTSAATAAVALGTLDAVTPTITGTAAVGATLTAHPGAWRPYPVLMTYQWNVDGVAFPGATKQTFAVPASASGKTITVTATGNVTGYAAASRTSSATTAVTGGTLAGPTPTITGTAQVGQTLTANPGHLGTGAGHPGLSMVRQRHRHQRRHLRHAGGAGYRTEPADHRPGHRQQVRLHLGQQDQRSRPQRSRRARSFPAPRPSPAPPRSARCSPPTPAPGHPTPIRSPTSGRRPAPTSPTRPTHADHPG